MVIRADGMSLAARLALAIGMAVAVVIAVTVIAVSAGVLGRFDTYLDQARAGRYADAATLAAELVRERGGLAIRGQELRRLAVVAGGAVVLRDPDGRVVAEVRDLPGVGPASPGRPANPGGGGGTGKGGGPGGAPASSADPVTIPIVLDGALVGTLEITPIAATTDPGAPAPAAFREDATAIVLGAGLVAVIATMLLTALLARRLTRPVRMLAAAARSVEAGDLSVRVDPPPDAESRELATAFNAMAGRLEQSEELRRRGTTDLAHELGTPITVLVGRLQAMADGTLPADGKTLEETRDVAEEIARLVGDLQDLAAAEGAALRRTATRADLRTVAARAVAAAQAMFEAAAVHLVLVPGEGDAPIAVVDERQVERAIANLLTNAATYTPAGGRVTVSASTDQGRVALRVGDTGPGIPEADLPHVFERFFRGAAGRSGREGARPAGTGIGLTVARDLVAANGGTLTVERTSADGTTFLASFPRA